MSFIGKNVIEFDEIPSTQKYAEKIVENNVENGTIIVAKYQTAGIGTHGRKWYTEDGKNITFTMILYPNCKIEKLSDFTLEVANAIVKAVEDLYNIKLDIKKPNDIICNEKKLGGILTQTKLLNEDVKYILIGIGLNTNQNIFDDEVKDIATSISNEFNIQIDNRKLINKICFYIEQVYNKMI